MENGFNVACNIRLAWLPSCVKNSLHTLYLCGFHSSWHENLKLNMLFWAILGLFWGRFFAIFVTTSTIVFSTKMESLFIWKTNPFLQITVFQWGKKEWSIDLENILAFGRSRKEVVREAMLLSCSWWLSCCWSVMPFWSPEGSWWSSSNR